MLIAICQITFGPWEYNLILRMSITVRTEMLAEWVRGIKTRRSMESETIDLLIIISWALTVRI